MHHKNVHIQKKKPKKQTCKICGKELCNAKTLLIHERSAHTGERPAVCSVCGTSFYHEDYLNIHMRLHTGEKPFKCPVCGQGYAQSCNMKSHIKHNHRLSQLDEVTRKNIHPRYLKHMQP
ncbi:zinc-finger double domain-containing protein [Phthorimaea operculella]|nr:zinc-finger double domain-containing protein [Phthorimaea operculella]